MKIGFFGAPIQLRVIYALIASLLWREISANADSLHLDAQITFWVTGAVFSALVLVPYLPGLKGASLLRALALLLCGSLSYWTAVYFAVDDDLNIQRNLPAFFASSVIWIGIAGVIGALIVGIGARLFIPLALRWRGWLMLAGAGLLGGMILGISLDAGFSIWGPTNYDYWLPGHMAWQVLVCLALYYGSRGNRTTGSSSDQGIPTVHP